MGYAYLTRNSIVTQQLTELKYSSDLFRCICRYVGISHLAADTSMQPSWRAGRFRLCLYHSPSPSPKSRTDSVTSVTSTMTKAFKPSGGLHWHWQELQQYYSSRPLDIASASTFGPFWPWVKSPPRARLEYRPRRAASERGRQEQPTEE